MHVASSRSHWFDTWFDRTQARQLRQQLEKMGRLDGALWVSSPLTRAIETMLLSCPKAHLMRCATSAAADGQQLKVMLLL